MQLDSPNSSKNVCEAISPSQFSARFTRLIFYTWAIPPVFGLSFLLWIRLFTPAQIRDVLLSPLEPTFILGSLAFALWFFRRYAVVIRDFLRSPDEAGRQNVTKIIQRFPLAFWTVFLVYLAMAPSSVMLSAEWFSDYQSQPLDWFRIHLVALIVCIVVGLPIFYMIFDLFGLVLGKISLKGPVLKIRTKVFLIGSLIPLLIDTLLVQYFWTRTGFFTFETFGVWFALEVGAIYGTLIFVRSFGQSLRPFEEFVIPSKADTLQDPGELVPMSTDELGVLVTRFRGLLERERVLETQLLHAQKLEAIGRLAGGVAHDFNNDLMAILGSAELLRDGLADGHPLKQHADAIIDASNRSAGIASSLLTFSRRRELKVEPVDLNAVVDDFASLAGRLMGNVVDIKTELCDRTTIVPIDRGQIEQAVMNLCLNARDAMPDGGELTLATHRVDKDDDGNEAHAILTVSDTGEGMDQHVQENIFEPYFTTKEDGLGTGLGLPMVYGIVVAHGGSIDFDSAPATGSTFSIRLPMTEAAVDTQPSSQPRKRRGNETVLLAEDNRSVRDLLTAQLESSGFSVVEAADGEEALQRYGERKNGIDVAVLDLRMPRKNGLEVSEAIRQHQPGLPIILISGNAREIPDSCINHPEITVVEKPFSPASLVEHVRRAIDS